MAGKLYIVATPIGNLEDITLRALRVLKEAKLIAAEDTRVTRKLLSHYDIHTPLTAYHQHSKGAKAQQIAEQIERGDDVALVSDAGTPGISDPGHELIADAIERGIDIVFVPGANALLMAVVVSGLPTTHFAFDGFPPRKEGDRRQFFQSVAHDPRTIVLYESPLRLMSTLRSALRELGDRKVCVLREATKLFEEVFRGRVTDAITRFSSPKPRGEIVLVIEGSSEPSPQAPSAAPQERLRELIADGVSLRDAVKQVAAELKLPHRDVYAAMLEMKKETQKA